MFHKVQSLEDSLKLSSTLFLLSKAQMLGFEELSPEVLLGGQEEHDS